jgi:hypothetical protein
VTEAEKKRLEEIDSTLCPRDCCGDVSFLLSLIERQEKALELAMHHIESTSCGKEPYRSNTVWRVKDQLGTLDAGREDSNDKA